MVSDRQNEIRQIKEEIHLVNRVIEEQKEMANAYPEDKALRAALDSLYFKRDLLVDEMIAARKVSGLSTFSIHLQGVGVKGSSIALKALGDFVNAFQDTITALVNKRLSGPALTGNIKKQIREKSELVLVDVVPGSFEMLIGSQSSYFGEPDYLLAMKDLNSMIDSVDDVEQIKAMRKKHGPRVFKKYKDIIYAIQSYELDVVFYGSHGNDIIEPREIKHQLAEKIIDVIKEVEDYPDEEITLVGYIWELNVHKGTLQFFDENGKVDARISESIVVPTVRDCMDVTHDKSNACKVKFSVSTKYNDIEDKESKEWTVIAIESVSK